VSSTDTYTQVMLESKALGRLVCWVESRYARLGARVRDETGAVWTVAERYVTWEKGKIDEQYRTVTRLQEVLG